MWSPRYRGHFYTLLKGFAKGEAKSVVDRQNTKVFDEVVNVDRKLWNLELQEALLPFNMDLCHSFNRKIGDRMSDIAHYGEFIHPWLLSQSSKHTRRAYDRIVSQFFTRNSSKDPGQITPVEISEYLSSIRKNGGQSKYNQARSALSSFFDFHIRCGRISINPVLAFKTKAVPLPSLRFLPDEQIYTRVVSAEIKLRNQIMLHFAFVLGLRISEILNLKRKSFIVAFNGDVFVSINGKGGKLREVFVPDWLWRLISLYMSENLLQPNEFLFFSLSDRNKSLSQYSAYKIFILAGKRVGLTIPMNPHKYRHGHAVTAYSRGANLKALKDEMGHGNLQALFRYIEQARFESPSSTFAEPGATLAIDGPVESRDFRESSAISS